MNFEHTLLLLLFFLPLAYKIAFWKEMFHLESSFWKALQRGYSHFWTYTEFPLFFGSLLVFLNPLLEVFFYNFLLYLFALIHIFLFGKMFRGYKVFAPEAMINLILGFCICILIFFIVDFTQIWVLYACMTCVYICLPLLFLFQKILWKK